MSAERARAQGYIYVATNPAMPGLVKIGRTDNCPSRRMTELHSTGVPEPFKLVFVAAVPDSALAERNVHTVLMDCRVHRGREFFRVSVVDAMRKLTAAIGPHQID
jgi:hypothetical protein